MRVLSCSHTGAPPSVHPAPRRARRRSRSSSVQGAPQRARRRSRSSSVQGARRRAHRRTRSSSVQGAPRRARRRSRSSSVQGAPRRGNELPAQGKRAQRATPWVRQGPPIMRPEGAKATTEAQNVETHLSLLLPLRGESKPIAPNPYTLKRD